MSKTIHRYKVPIEVDEVETIRREYEEIRNRNGGDAIHNPDALAALDLVRRLLDDADQWEEQWEEEAVFVGGPTPEDCSSLITHPGARDLHEHMPEAGLARRSVRAWRWQVIEESAEGTDSN